MPLPVQISFHGMPWSGPLARAILQRLDRLNALYPRVADWRVTVESVDPWFGKRRFSTLLEVDVPGCAPTTTHGRARDALDAFDQAACAARLELSRLGYMYRAMDVGGRHRH